MAEARARQAEGGVGDVDAVDEHRRLRGVAARADDRAVADEAEAAALALHARREEGQLLPQDRQRVWAQSCVEAGQREPVDDVLSIGQLNADER